MYDQGNELTSQLIPSHHPQYWQSRKLAFAAIRALEGAVRDIKRAPLYVCSGYDEDGEPTNVVGNIAPFERLAAMQKSVANNPNAVSILTSQKRLYLLECLTF